MNKRRKRPNGMGSIYKRPDGRYEGKLTLSKDNRVSVYARTYNEALRKIEKKRAEYINSLHIIASDMTLADFFAEWEAACLSTKKPSTVATYKQKINNHIIPNLGSVKLSELTHHNCQCFISSLSKDTEERKALSAKSIRDVQGILHTALSYAVLNNLIQSNPAAHCSLPTVEATEPHTLTNDDAKRFLQAASNDEYYDLYITDLLTGLRLGELLGLTWDCIDFERCEIHVKYQLQQEKKKNAQYHLVSLKNNKPRVVMMPNIVSDRLSERKKRQEELKSQFKQIYNKNDEFADLVFTSELGDCIKMSTIRKHFKKVVESIDCDDVRIHDLRHSYATACLQNGDDIKTVQDSLGHSSPSFTLKKYGHVSDVMRAHSKDRLDEYYDKLVS